MSFFKNRLTEIKHRRESFLKDTQGAAAVEFAMISIPFFILIFGLIELALLFLYSTTLDYGMAEASRRIRTGELQTQAGIESSDFKELICGNLFGLMACDDKLRVDVRVFASFNESSSGEDDEVQDEDGEFDDSALNFAMGSANDIVLVRVFYEYQLFTPVMSASLTNMPDGRRLLTSSMVFRNEPF